MSAAMIDLHHSPGTASMAPHFLLLELGLQHRLVPVDPAQLGHKTADYLRLNPNGLIPAMVHRGLEGGDLVLYESAAICLYLADLQPQAGLMPAVGTRERALATQWLVWLTNTLQATLIHYFYPERMVNAGDAAAAAQVKAAAEARVGSLLPQLQAQCTGHGQPWLLGARFSLVDLYAFMLCRWTRNFGQPARSVPGLDAWLQRVMARPAVQQGFAIEGLALPWV